jgi:hypothetical protein
LSRTFITLNNSLNLESKELESLNNKIDIASSIGILNQTLLKNNELNCTEPELSKCETRNGLLGADIATDQTKASNTEVSPRTVFKSNPSTIRSITDQNKWPTSSSASREANTEQTFH